MSESLFERFKKFAASGTPPQDQRGKGSSGTITGRIMPQRKSVKEKAALAAKNKKAKSPVANKRNRRYSDNVTKSNTKVGTVFSGEARNIADAKKRKSKTFINKKGKKLAAVTKEELAASGLTLRQYLNKQQGKTAKGSTTKGLDGPNKNVKRPVKKTFKENLPPYDTMGYFGKGGKVMKAAKGKLAKDAFDVLFSKIKGAKADFLSEKAHDLVKKFDEGKIKLPALKGELRKRMGDSFKKIKRRQGEVEEAGYLKEYRDKGKKVFPKKKAGGMLKTPPAGSKGKGLRKLPTSVRNKMGYKKRGGMLKMSGGGSASGFGRAAMRPGKDPRTISKT